VGRLREREQALTVNINWETVLVASIPLLISIIGFIFNWRQNNANARAIEKKADTDAIKSITEGASIVQKDATDLLTNSREYYKSRLAEQEQECEEDKSKLRQDLASALVDVSILKEENAKLRGYVQGLTDPLVKLEDSQRAALRGGRRVTDAKP
jgi:hypothetical protein